MPSCSSHKRRECVGRWFCYVVFCLMVCGGAIAQEIVLHLRNGDRLSGRIISESTNAVVLSTAFSEKVAIPANLIARREAKPTGGTNEGARPPAPASGVVGELILTNKPSMAQTAGGATTPAEAKPAEVKPGQPKVAESKPEVAKKEEAKPGAKPPEPSGIRKFIAAWRGEAQLGANLGFSTKERQAFSGRINLAHNHKLPNGQPMRNILTYDMTYGTTDGVLSDNRMEGTWKTEYDLNKRVLVYNATRAGYDEIRNIDLQYGFGPGLGYKWLVETNLVFKTELGADYHEQFFAGGKHSRRYSLRLAEDLWWQITPKLRWDEKIEFFPVMGDVGDYRVRLETNLSYLLRQNLTLTLNLVDLYDTSVPEGVSKNDLQIRSLLGIKF